MGLRRSAGYDHACALLVDGTVRCWGDNQSLQLGTTAGSLLLGVPAAFALVRGNFFGQELRLRRTIARAVEHVHTLTLYQRLVS